MSLCRAHRLAESPNYGDFSHGNRGTGRAAKSIKIMTRALAAWFLVAAAVAGQATPPREVVQATVTRIVTVLREQPDGDRMARTEFIEKRRAEMRRIAVDVFDFEEMARRALGRYWTARTRAEQTEFVDLFTDLLEQSYVGRIEAYAGERILYPGELVDGNYATVRSRIVGLRRGETTLDYRMHLDRGRWRVFDITVDGVSFVGTYRSEFDRIIRSSSYASLLERLKKKRVEIDPLSRRPDRPEPSASPRSR